MKMESRRVVSALASLLVAATGCSRVKVIDSPMKQLQTVPALTAPAGSARLIVVRPHRGTAFRLAYHVIIDGQYVGDSFDDTAFSVDLSPGPHKICAGNGPNVIGNFEPNRTYLTRIDLTFTNAKATAVKSNSGQMKELLADLPQIRGAATIYPFTEDALQPSEANEQATDCAESDKGLSASDRSEQTLTASDAL